MGGDGEGEADIHSRGVVLYGSLNEFLQFGEGDNFVKFATYFSLAHTQNGSAQIGVFTPRELRMEARSNFQKAADAAVNLRPAGGGASDAGEDFEKSGLAGAIAADKTEDFAFANFEGYV